ncbi:MAG: prepilin-type N-terminal cleavage/methylation domain-containing protein [Gemmatimonadaceae bacterium]|nr:prepilin-type N-terminal cleavage/methylation domain-containing protein [Gemmatimonadaceae bacterium]
MREGKSPRSRPGLTLLELVVTLAILSVTLALVGPALVLRQSSPDELFSNLVSDSRRVATRRAQAVQLDLGADGSWTLSGGGPQETGAIIQRGRISASPGKARVSISPIGICIMDQSDIRMRIDPLTCNSNIGNR